MEGAGVTWCLTEQDRYDWPDGDLNTDWLEDAVRFPPAFGSWLLGTIPGMRRCSFVDARWDDLAERAARAVNTQDFLLSLERDLGVDHPFTAEIMQAWWRYNDRQTAPLGSRRGMIDPRSNEFLQSFAWRRLRWQFLQQHESRCQVCGRTARDGIKINVDHIEPRKTHPHLALEPGNLQVLCNECNHGKGNARQKTSPRVAV